MIINLFNKIIVLFYLITPSLVYAQSLNLAIGESEQPIEITADDGIEWQREKQIMIASGKAKATRGQSSVEAHKLRAFYKKNRNGASNLSRLDAIGRVRITSPTQQLTGEMGVYDLLNGILV